MNSTSNKTYWNRGLYQGYEYAKTHIKIYLTPQEVSDLYVSTDGTKLTRRQEVVNQGFRTGIYKANLEFERNKNVVPDSWIREIESIK